MSKAFIFVNTDGNYEDSQGAYEIADFISTSTGASDAGKPVVLDAAGQIDATMINSADVDHNQTTNYDIAEHRIINDSGTSSTELWSADKINTEITRIDTIFADQNDPTGFVDRLQSTLSFVDGTRTFTITRTGASYDIYSEGTKTTISTDNSIVISATVGTHYIYYDGNTLNESTTFSEDYITGGLVFVAAIYWNGTEGFVVDERHGLMDNQVHTYLHNTRGTAYDSGFDISGFTLDSDTDADVTIGLTNGRLRDEDIIIDAVHAASPSANFEQILTDPAQFQIYYRSGASGVWQRDAASTFPMKSGTTLLAYNEDTGSTWQQTELASGEFTETWVVGTAIIDGPVIVIQGWEKFADLSSLNTDVQARISAIFSSDTLAFEEFKLLYRLGWETDSTFGGTKKAKLVVVDDYRANAQLGGSTGSVVTDHGALSGLTDLDHPASAIISDTSSYNGRLSASDTTVQLALDTLDDHVHDDRYYTETELDTGALDSRYYTETELDGGQLDNIYYQESEFISSSAGVADAGKPIVLDAGGQLDGSFIDASDIDHGSVSGLGDDDHPQYSLVDGSRDYTAVVSYSSHPSFTSDTQIVDKKYVDDIALGLEHQDSVIDLSATPPGSPSTGDRYLVTATATGAWAGQEDNIAEWNGTAWEFFTPSTGWQLSADDETDGIYYYGGSSWTKKSYEATTASLGVKKVGVDVQADLVASGGIKLVGNSMRIEPGDFAGEGVVDDGSDNLALDWSTLFNDAKPVRAQDLSSLANGFGASIIGLEDAAGNTSETTVEGAISELYSLNSTPGNTFTSAGVTKGDVVYMSANNTVATMPINANNRPVGIAATTEAASASVNVLKDQSILTGVLTSATFGTRYYWNGSAYQTSVPTGAGAYVFTAGIAVNSTDLLVDVDYIKRNA